MRECSASTCINNGTCFSSGGATLSCACLDGFGGSRCQIDVRLVNGTSNTLTTPGSTGGLSAGAIAGIVIATVIIGLAVACGIALALKYQRQKHAKNFHNEMIASTKQSVPPLGSI